MISFRCCGVRWIVRSIFSEVFRFPFVATVVRVSRIALDDYGIVFISGVFIIISRCFNPPSAIATHFYFSCLVNLVYLGLLRILSYKPVENSSSNSVLKTQRKLLLLSLLLSYSQSTVQQQSIAYNICGIRIEGRWKATTKPTKLDVIFDLKLIGWARFISAKHSFIVNYLHNYRSLHRNLTINKYSWIHWTRITPPAATDILPVSFSLSLSHIQWNTSFFVSIECISVIQWFLFISTQI